MSGWVEAFIVIAALSIFVQMCILVAMFVQVRVAVTTFTRIGKELQDKIDPILQRTNRILENSEDRIASIMSDASELTRLARSQAQKADRIVTEATDRLRAQIIRTDQILTGTLEVIEEAGTTFRNKVWQPVNQVSAVIKGIKAALEVLGMPRRRRSTEATMQDEELFI
jgi:predicted PurR-regulated permease PerM